MNLTENASVPPWEETIPPDLQLGLSILLVLLCGSLLLVALMEVMMVVHFGYRLLSHQTAYLLTCSFWAGLRTALFSYDIGSQAASFGHRRFLSWVLLSLPVVVQYVLLNIIVHYFLKVWMKMHHPSCRHKIWACNAIVFLLTVLLLVTSVVMSVVHQDNTKLSRSIVLARVSVTYSLFLLSTLVLCCSVMKLEPIRYAKLAIEDEQVSSRKVACLCLTVFLLFLTRGAYNVLVLVDFDVPKLNSWLLLVTDQGERLNSVQGVCASSGGSIAVSLGIIVMLWEALPICITLWYFRVRRPTTQPLSSTGRESTLSSFTWTSIEPTLDRSCSYLSHDFISRCHASASSQTDVIVSACPANSLPNRNHSQPPTNARLYTCYDLADEPPQSLLQPHILLPATVPT